MIYLIIGRILSKLRVGSIRRNKVVIPILRIMLGTIELLMGRRIFWLMIGIVGFLFGLFVTLNYLQLEVWLNILAGLVAGVIFAGLALVIPKVMVAILGFIAFGITAVTIAAPFGLERGSILFWILFVLAGLFGASLVFWLFDWALIIGTSMIGATSILSGLGTLTHVSSESLLWLIFFLFLLAIGVSFQSKDLKLSA
jgi:hypothetical protein